MIVQRRGVMNSIHSRSITATDACVPADIAAGQRSPNSPYRIRAYQGSYQQAAPTIDRSKYHASAESTQLKTVNRRRQSVAKCRQSVAKCRQSVAKVLRRVAARRQMAQVSPKCSQVSPSVAKRCQASPRCRQVSPKCRQSVAKCRQPSVTKSRQIIRLPNSF